MDNQAIIENLRSFCGILIVLFLTSLWLVLPPPSSFKGFGVNATEKSLKERVGLIKRSIYLKNAQDQVVLLEKYSKGEPSGYGMASSVVKDAYEAIAAAKGIGIKLADLEARVNMSEPWAYWQDAKKQVVLLEKYSKGEPSGYGMASSVIYDAHESIVRAKSFGINVLDLKMRADIASQAASFLDLRNGMDDLIKQCEIGSPICMLDKILK